MASKTPKVRNLGQVGVITDLDPYDLPVNGLSFAKNVRFKNNKIQTGPCFKRAVTLTNTQPRYITAYLSDENQNDVYIGYLDGTVNTYANATLTNSTLSTWAPVSNEAVWSSALLGDLVYLNNNTRPPWYINQTESTFQNLATYIPPAPTNPEGVVQATVSGTNMTVTSVTSGALSIGALLTGTGIPYGTKIVSQTSGTSGGAGVYVISNSATVATAEQVYVSLWDDSWPNPTGWGTTAPATAQLIKSLGGALIALGVTNGGTGSRAGYVPTSVMTSAFAVQGSPPPSWQYNDPSTSATYNILGEMEGAIVDACNLGNNLVIYSNTQTWLMTPDTYSGNVWDYVQLPFQRGAINSNCTVQVNAQNYVFGSNDIWVHDGVNEQSICDQRTREWIFSSLNMTEASRCFVVHNQELMEIAFCFVSGDAYLQFENSNDSDFGCNRAAVYSYATNTWTFDDLPRVFSGTRTNLDVVPTWDTVTGTWVTQSATWQAYTDSAKRCLCYVGETSSSVNLTAAMYAFDYDGAAGVSSFPVDSTASSFPYVERQGIDLDDAGSTLQGYKQINYIIPQGRIDSTSTQSIQFRVGAAAGYNDPVVWGQYWPYDGNTNNLIDARVSGKYLAFSCQFNDTKSFTLSGFDIDCSDIGLWR